MEDERPYWTTRKQMIIDNIGIELLDLNDQGEEKSFISITKFDKAKNVVIPLNLAAEVGRKMQEMASE